MANAGIKNQRNVLVSDITTRLVLREGRVVSLFGVRTHMVSNWALNEAQLSGVWSARHVRDRVVATSDPCTMPTSVLDEDTQADDWSNHEQIRSVDSESGRPLARPPEPPAPPPPATTSATPTHDVRASCPPG